MLVHVTSKKDHKRCRALSRFHRVSIMVSSRWYNSGKLAAKNQLMPSLHSLLRFIAIGDEVCDTGDNRS